MVVRHRFDRMTDVAEAIAGHGGRDAGLHPAPCRVDEVAQLARHVADEVAPRAVGVPAVDDAADVDAQHVALGDPALRGRDAVDHFVVDARADRARKRRVAAVALEGRRGARVADHPLRDRVERAGRQPGAQLGVQDVEDLGQDAARAPHGGDLLGTLDRDGRRAAAERDAHQADAAAPASSASRMRRLTSGIARRPSMRVTTPAAS